MRLQNKREAQLQAFLKGCDWGNAERGPLAGDASNRKYERLSKSDGSKAVLMDAPPDRGEDVRPFQRIADFLSQNGMSAPEIFAADTQNGFLLLEDLGDDLFARVVANDHQMESQLYGSAIDALIALHDIQPPSDLPTYSASMMAEKAAMAWRWYLRVFSQDYEHSAATFEAKFETILAQIDAKSTVLIQRDYHAENLLWLPEREGIARVGMLDFQDALKGHRSYDLVSLLQDARRDVSPALELEMIDRYLSQSDLERDVFVSDYHLLGLQRNLRILGIFARLSMHFGKASYIDFIPRVWAYVERDLAHSAADDIRDLILHDLPAPSPEHLQRLRDLCGTIPTP